MSQKYVTELKTEHLSRNVSKDAGKERHSFNFFQRKNTEMPDKVNKILQ